MIILSDHDKHRELCEYDIIVCVELPNSILQPQLHTILKRCMMHGACGVANKSAPCLKDGKCSKRFPKAFSAVTTTSEDGYPLYRRRNDDRTVIVGTLG